MRQGARRIYSRVFSCAFRLVAFPSTASRCPVERSSGGITGSTCGYPNCRVDERCAVGEPHSDMACRTDRRIGGPRVCRARQPAGSTLARDRGQYSVGTGRRRRGKFRNLARVGCSPRGRACDCRHVYGALPPPTRRCCRPHRRHRRTSGSRARLELSHSGGRTEFHPSGRGRNCVSPLLGPFLSPPRDPCFRQLPID